MPEEASAPGPALDPFHGDRPLAGCFRSAVLLPAHVDGADDFRVPAAALARWLVAWDGWFMAGLARAPGGLAATRHLLYEREVALELPRPPMRVDAVVTVAHACRALGLPLALEVPVESDADLESLLAAAGRAAPATTTLRLGQRSPLPSPARWHETIVALVRLGTALPCRALLGVEPARLGSVDDPLQRTVLGGAGPGLDLVALAADGPGAARARVAPDGSGHAEICLGHRAWLTRRRAGDAQESPG